MLPEQYIGLSTLKRPEFFEFLYGIALHKTFEENRGDFSVDTDELGYAFMLFREKFQIAEQKQYDKIKLQKTIIALAIYATARHPIVASRTSSEGALSPNDVTAFHFGLLIYAFEYELMSKDRRVYALRGIDVEKISAEMLNKSIKVIEIAKAVELGETDDGTNFLALRYLYQIMLGFAALHLY